MNKSQKQVTNKFCLKNVKNINNNGRTVRQKRNHVMHISKLGNNKSLVISCLSLVDNTVIIVEDCTCLKEKNSGKVR